MINSLFKGFLTDDGFSNFPGKFKHANFSVSFPAEVHTNNCTQTHFQQKTRARQEIWFNQLKLYARLASKTPRKLPSDFRLQEFCLHFRWKSKFAQIQQTFPQNQPTFHSTNNYCKQLSGNTKRARSSPSEGPTGACPWNLCGAAKKCPPEVSRTETLPKAFTAERQLIGGGETWQERAFTSSQSWRVLAEFGGDVGGKRGGGAESVTVWSVQPLLMLLNMGGSWWAEMVENGEREKKIGERKMSLAGCWV